jgi:hypothetical protein
MRGSVPVQEGYDLGPAIRDGVVDGEGIVDALKAQENARAIAEGAQGIIRRWAGAGRGGLLACNLSGDGVHRVSPQAFGAAVDIVHASVVAIAICGGGRGLYVAASLVHRVNML